VPRRLASILALALAVSVAAGPAQAGGGLPRKTYHCYVFFSPGVPTYTGRTITIKSARKYAWFDSKSTRPGKYKRSGDKIKFKSGPLKGKKGTRKHYSSGAGINITFQTSAGTSNYYCS
jgi:hypothetical protein